MIKYLLLLLFPINVLAVTLPYTFTTNVPPSQVNANFSALRDAINDHLGLNSNSNFIVENLVADPVCDLPSK